jgi:hypothetical protein
MAMKADVTFDASETVAKCAAFADRLRAGILEIGQIMAERIADAAKDTAIWIDRTSNARQGLVARAAMEGSKLVIHLFHSMSYGKWLELAMGQKYAIIMATLRSYYPRVMSLVRRLITGG